jgi:hypothetical protein
VEYTVPPRSLGAMNTMETRNQFEVAFVIKEWNQGKRKGKRQTRELFSRDALNFHL